MITKKIKDIFNYDCLYVDEIQIPKNKNNVPKLISNYVFEEQKLNNIILYLASAYKDGLYLYGPQGCGKTSIINQIAARLNWSVEECTLCNKSDITELIGFNTIVDGQLKFVYGPLIRAMINGSILIINEIDTISAGDLTILNDVIEGRPLTILANNGEVVYPHPCFRIVATANTNGQGDNSGQFIGTRLFNTAFLDRWRFIKFDYPSNDFEFTILKMACNKAIKDETINLLIKYANLVRENFVENSDSELTLSSTISTRILLKVLHIYSLVDCISMQKALNIAFISRYSESEQVYLKRIAIDLFGSSEYTESHSASMENKKALLDNKESTTEDIKEVQEEVQKESNTKVSKTTRRSRTKKDVV